MTRIEQLKRTLNEGRTPVRVFAALVHFPKEILRNLSACIARHIIEFSSQQAQLKEILDKFEGFPSNQIDMLLCKKRLVQLAAIKQVSQRQSDWRYWQNKSNTACINACQNFYQIIVNDQDYKKHFHIFIQWAIKAYGFNEAKLQLQETQERVYDFGNFDSNLLQTQKFNRLAASRSYTSGERVAYSHFLELLRERF